MSFQMIWSCGMSGNIIRLNTSQFIAHRETKLLWFTPLLCHTIQQLSPSNSQRNQNLEVKLLSVVCGHCRHYTLVRTLDLFIRRKNRWLPNLRSAAKSQSKSKLYKLINHKLWRRHIFFVLNLISG